MSSKKKGLLSLLAIAAVMLVLMLASRRSPLSVREPST